MSAILHYFVLVLENRSFDHMLGFSEITGTDAITNQPTKIDGITNDSLNNTCYNIYNNIKFESSMPAKYSINNDPGHEFIDVFKQICGPDAKYDAKSGGYDASGIVKSNSGFVWDYVNSPSQAEGYAKSDFDTVMQAYDTKTQLPIFYTLAKEFAVCDKWFSSMPGPTFSNRLFFHGASSAGLDDSPTDLQIDTWDTIDGFKFENGTIYDKLTKNNIPWHIYSGKKDPPEGSIPQAASLAGITVDKWSSLDDFAEDINNDYPYFYTFIEPNYGDIISGTFK
jgi:phospholipase C